MSNKRHVIDDDNLIKEWDWEKNNKLGLSPHTMCLGSAKKAWWICSKNHSWEASCNNRNTGFGCPYCAGKKILKGYNDLASKNPILAEEWNYDKNSGLLPTMVSEFSHKKVWWICSKGHEWESRIADRSSGNGCPICAGQKIIKGINDLATTHPHLCLEWNYDKNVNMTPNETSKGSTKKVWWICKKGHEWYVSPNARAKGSGCPICSNRQVVLGYNDLATTHPNLCLEWNYKKNIDITPKDVTAGSEKKVWWVCKKGHEWHTSISCRVAGTNCPHCQKERHTSLPEKSIFYYISKYFENSVENYKPQYLKKMEFDIFIPTLNVGIEYDGEQWHKNLQHDIQKNLICETNNIKLIRIREKNCPVDNNEYNNITYIQLQDNSTSSLANSIQLILSILGVNHADINLEQDHIKIMELLEMNEKENSISNKKPHLIKEWNWNKNGLIKPEYINFRSNKKVWWICKHGHEWQATVDSRTQGNSCPFCSNRMVTVGVNDLLTKNSQLAKEWDTYKNTLTPSEIFSNSSKKYWWKCNNGHSYSASPYDRIHGRGCPYCSGKKVLVGFNDLETKNPTLANQWNHEKNGLISPKTVTQFSGKKVWWKCEKGHEWEAEIASRSNGNGCPYCSGRISVAGINDLKTTNKTLCLEWNYDKNNNQLPQSFTKGSNKKVWWKCSKCGHEWQARIADRVSGTKCPKCRGKQKSSM